MVIAMVIMSCNEIKFEEITVTSHPKKPKIPEVITTEIEQVNTGKIIHLTCLKITDKVIMRKRKIERPNICKSFFTKETTSFAFSTR